MLYHRIAGQFFNRPLLVLPETAQTIGSFLLSRMTAGGPVAGNSIGGIEHDAGESLQMFPSSERADGSREAHTPRASRFYGEVPMSEDGTRRPMPFRRTAEGVAIITLVGEWVNRGGWVGASSGLISYEGFKYQLIAAAADPRTTSILLDLESPGGQAVGCFEAADVVRQVAGSKPVTALVNGMAASAAYAIASAASRVVCIPTGIAGSIGVVLCHLDLSEYLKNEGIKPTFIFAGEHKVDGNPYEPLPDAVRDELQAEVEAFYGLFVAGVAKGRTNLTVQQIRDTQARCFMGQEAVTAGLADTVGTFEEVLADLSRTPSSGASRPKGTQMNFTQADIDAARAEGVTEGKASRDADVASAKTAGATAERGRIKSILGSEHAKGREKSATHFALNTDLDLAAAEGALSGMDKSTSLDSRMAGREELNLDPDKAPDADRAAKAAERAKALDPTRIYEARRAATGGK